MRSFLSPLPKYEWERAKESNDFGDGKPPFEK
jgi:hypothetical protein